MGFKFRKSINLGGGFKVNLSKSGVGYSWGTKGVRFSKTASGKSRTTLTIPGTGISHVMESGGKKKSTKQNNTKSTNNLSFPDPNNMGSGGIGNPWVKFLICLFFGCFGVHKFMEKKVGMGILYLFTMGLLGFGWIYDCIKYLIAAIKNTNSVREEFAQIVEENTEPVTKYPPVELPEVRNIPVKKILLWILTGLLGIFALAFLPRFSGVLFLVAAAAVAPIEKWQNLIARFVKGKMKAIAVAAMAVLALVTAPAPDVPETEPAVPVITVQETEEPTEPATAAPTEAPTEPPAEVERISFYDGIYVIGVGRTVDIPFALYPENGETGTLEVSIDNTEVASVSIEKKNEHTVQVAGIVPGEAMVTLRSGDTITATKTVTVAEVMPEEITITSEPQEIRIGSSGIFAVTFDPVDVTKRAVTWQSDTPKVITVNEDGSFEAVSIGEATITATHENGVSGTLVVSVLPVEVETVTLTSNWEEGKHFCKGDSMTLAAEVGPENATDKSLTWTSSDETVATVSDKGVVKAVAPGTVEITAEATSGKTGTYQITVDISPQKFRVSASIRMQSNDHVGNNWSTGFEFNGEEIRNGSVVSIMPGDSFTACGWAQDNDSKPDYGDYDEKLTLDNEMCQNGFTIEGEANVRENGGRYSGHYATWYVKMTFTPVY